jgi:protocatechuate 3,4-dioxygenase beta subunit
MSGADGPHPPLHYPDYKSTLLRAPRAQAVRVSAPQATLPRLYENVGHDADLTRQGKAAPLGQRIFVHGRVCDEGGRPLSKTLVELWQANAAGRYAHAKDQWNAPLDPNFSGAGRTITDDDGRYRFVTVRPGAYPWGNHYNAWRPAHIHFSLLGPTMLQRLVTQMYFPGDDLLALDPIAMAVPARARARLVAAFDHEQSEPSFALAYRFDIVLRGPVATPIEGQP